MSQRFYMPVIFLALYALYGCGRGESHSSSNGELKLHEVIIENGTSIVSVAPRTHVLESRLSGGSNTRIDFSQNGNFHAHILKMSSGASIGCIADPMTGILLRINIKNNLKQPTREIELYPDGSIKAETVYEPAKPDQTSGFKGIRSEYDRGGKMISQRHQTVHHG